MDIRWRFGSRSLELGERTVGKSNKRKEGRWKASYVYSPPFNECTNRASIFIHSKIFSFTPVDIYRYPQDTSIFSHRFHSTEKHVPASSPRHLTNTQLNYVHLNPAQPYSNAYPRDVGRVISHRPSDAESILRMDSRPKKQRGLEILGVATVGLGPLS